MIEDISIDDLKGMQQFQDKVNSQIQTLTSFSEKVSSIKENYDKKFEGLVAKFKEIEEKFINEYFEEKILGELKNSKEKQKEIVS